MTQETKDATPTATGRAVAAIDNALASVTAAQEALMEAGWALSALRDELRLDGAIARVAAKARDVATHRHIAAEPPSR